MLGDEEWWEPPPPWRAGAGRRHTVRMGHHCQEVLVPSLLLHLPPRPQCLVRWFPQPTWLAQIDRFLRLLRDEAEKDGDF
jgi:hypothetical protein